MVSCSTKTPVDLQDEQTFKTDFVNCEIEHIIEDDKANGYEPGKLVYVLNQKILIACSPNGRVIAWEISDDSTNIVDEFQVERTLRSCKAVDVDESTTLLLLGVNQDVLIYEVKERKFSFKHKIECYFAIIDIEINNIDNKLYVIGNSEYVNIYNLKDFLLEDQFKTTTIFGIDSTLYRAIYIEKDKALALEDISGLNVYNLDKSKGIRSLNWFKCQLRRSTGLGYLPKSNRFLLRTENFGVSILDGETFTVTASCQNLLCGDAAEFRFIANEDESQIIGNTNYLNFAVYEPDLLRYSRFYLSNHIKKTGAIEVLKGKSRFAVGDLESGTIVVLKSNASGPDRIKPSRGKLIAGKKGQQRNKSSQSENIEETKKAAEVSKTEELFEKEKPLEAKSKENTKSKTESLNKGKEDKATEIEEVKSASSKKKVISKKNEKSQESDEETETREEKSRRGRRRISEERKDKKQENTSKERSKEKSTKKPRQKSETKKKLQH